VEDTWKVDEPFVFTRAGAAVRVEDDTVSVVQGFTRKSSVRPDPSAYAAAIEAGRCTHDEVRYVLEKSIPRPEIIGALRARLAVTIRSLIVDRYSMPTRLTWRS